MSELAYHPSKLFLQDNKTYKEYKTHITKKLSALKQRKTDDINKETYIKEIQNKLYDSLCKVNINEEGNEIKVNITENEYNNYESIPIKQTPFISDNISDKDIMSKYWKNYNKRKLEELDRRKNEVICIKQGIIFKKDKQQK